MAPKANTKIRLLVDGALGADTPVTLSREQAHYLKDVMRRAAGDGVILFNGRDGEWRAELTELERKAATARCVEQLRPQSPELSLWLLFAPVKKARLDIIVEKAVELGVSRLQPVITRHTDVERVKTARLEAQVREAAEQCERLTVPEVMDPVALTDALSGWPAERPLLFADEAGGAPALSALRDMRADEAAILIGPEGGFAPQERQAVTALPGAVRLSLGPRILRAETAVIAMLTLWQAARGDWR
jgi:16S rRNA (uracil1498-N3)-methyltransferase